MSNYYKRIFKVTIFDHTLMWVGVLLLGIKFGLLCGLATFLICEALYHPGMIESE